VGLEGFEPSTCGL